MYGLAAVPLLPCSAFLEVLCPGTRAHSFSVPMLVASHSGQSEKAQELMSDMEASLNEEARSRREKASRRKSSQSQSMRNVWQVSSKKISPSTEAWMLGRLLAANCHLRADADGIAEKLRGWKGGCICDKAVLQGGRVMYRAVVLL